MSTIEQPIQVDGEKLMQFVFRAVDEVGATLNAALVVMGDKLGWYRALAGSGGLSPAELAERTGASERYVREWLNAQAAGGFVAYDPDSGLYSLPPEQTVALTDSSSPAYLPGFFQIALGSVLDSPRIMDAARSGAASRGATTSMMFTKAASGSSGRATTLTWCRNGCRRSTAWSTSSSVARSSPTSAAGTARRRSSWRRPSRTRRSSARTTTTDRSRPRAGAPRRQAWRTAFASTWPRPPGTPATGYDLVTMFDCLHDMGDPVGAARHVRSTLKPDGTWMIVEPNAGDRVEDNLNPVGRAYYAFSTLLCTPASLSQEVGLALGAQAGEARIRDVVEAGGFTRFRRAAETPFNLVFESRP